MLIRKEYTNRMTKNLQQIGVRKYEYLSYFDKVLNKSDRLTVATNVDGSVKVWDKPTNRARMGQ